MDVLDAQAEILARLYLAALRGAVESLEKGLAPLDEIASIFTTIALAGAHAVAEPGSGMPSEDTITAASDHRGVTPP